MMNRKHRMEIEKIIEEKDIEEKQKIHKLNERIEMVNGEMQAIRNKMIEDVAMKSAEIERVMAER